MYKNHRILAVVTARLGSRRLKQKNIMPILGEKNLLNWTYEACSKSLYLDKIILSSESKKIIKVAKKIGFTVPFIRPKHLSKNNVDAEKPVLHAIKKTKIKYSYVMLLQPTSPLRSSIDIDKSIEKIVNNNLKSLISISKSSIMKKFRVSIRKEKYIKLDFDSKKKFSYYLNGAIFIAETNFFLKKKKFIYSNTGFVFMPASRSIDIDTLKDLKKFKVLIKRK